MLLKEIIHIKWLLGQCLKQEMFWMVVIFTTMPPVVIIILINWYVES